MKNGSVGVLNCKCATQWVRIEEPRGDRRPGRQIKGARMERALTNRRIAADQKRNFSAICTRRPGSASEISPKLGELMSLFGRRKLA